MSKLANGRVLGCRPVFDEYAGYRMHRPFRMHVARPALLDGTCNSVILLTTHTLTVQAFEKFTLTS